MRRLFAWIFAPALPWEQKGPQHWACLPYEVFPLPYDEGFAALYKGRSGDSVHYDDRSARRACEIHAYINGGNK